MIELLQGFFQFLGMEYIVDVGDVAGILSIILLISLSILNLLTTEKSARHVTPKIVLEEAVVSPKIPWSERLAKGLSRSRHDIWGKIENIFIRGLSEESIEEIEELLYAADIGPATVIELIEELQEKVKKSTDFSSDDFKMFLFDFLKGRMEETQKSVDSDLFEWNQETHKGLRVMMIVGVNGAGKTTTIGKLATKLTRQGAKVVVGACDTFRAAAVDQLAVWCERSGAEMVRAREGSDPSGVAYGALERAIKIKADYCLLDTAGRLHTKENLMEELKKNKRVLAKLDESAPHDTLLVIDAVTGQNAMRQAEEFHRALTLTGLIFTKCDGSSKAGSAISIVQKLQVPITYIGVGETVDDINKFCLDEYLKILLGMS